MIRFIFAVLAALVVALLGRALGQLVLGWDTEFLSGWWAALAYMAVINWRSKE